LPRLEAYALGFIEDWASYMGLQSRWTGQQGPHPGGGYFVEIDDATSETVLCLVANEILDGNRREALRSFFSVGDFQSIFPGCPEPFRFHKVFPVAERSPPFSAMIEIRGIRFPTAN
jgi:hypothetical protein